MRSKPSTHCREGKERGGSSLENGDAASIQNPTEVDLACSLFTGMSSYCLLCCHFIKSVSCIRIFDSLMYHSGLMERHGKAVGTVAVLSSYRAQVTALQTHFNRVHGAATLSTVDFHTIDGFQVLQPYAPNNAILQALSLHLSVCNRGGAC